MKFINFNDSNYQCPEKWEEVTLRMILKVSELSELLPESPMIAIISGYVGIPVESIKSSNISKVNEIVSILSFISEPYVPVPTNEFTLYGKRYSTIPDLAETEFQDWLSIQTIMYNNKENPVRGLPRILAVYCKLPGEKLDDINMNERSELFMDLPITSAKDVEGFFLSSQLVWKQITQLFSKERELEQATLQHFNELSNIMKVSARGYGWYSPTKFLIGLYRLYLKYLKRDLEKSFSSTHSERSGWNSIKTVKT